MGEKPFLGTDNPDPGEFKAFSRMHGHELHGVLIGFLVPVARLERRLREKPLHGRRRIVAHWREGRMIKLHLFIFKPPLGG